MTLPTFWPIEVLQELSGGQVLNRKFKLDSKCFFLFPTCPLKSSVATSTGQNVGKIRQIYGVCLFLSYTPQALPVPQEFDGGQVENKKNYLGSN